MRRFNLIALAAFIAALVWVFTFDNATARSIQNRVGAIFAPFKRTGAGVQNAVTGASDEKRTPEQLSALNEKLAIENAELFEQAGAGDMHSMVRKAAANLNLKRGRITASQMDVYDSLRLVEKPTLTQRIMKFLIRMGFR